MDSKTHVPGGLQLKSVVETICGEIDSRKSVLHNVSRQIHANPELNFKEFYAHDYLTGVLEQHGFVVERQYKNIATAFRSEITSGEFQNSQHGTVVICCEYDALPQIGHGNYR